MAKKVEDAVLDGALDVTATSVIQRVCASEPADRTAAIAATLASVALTPGDGNGDFTIANGDVSGRKVTITQQSDVPVTTTGTATHVAYDDGAVLTIVTTCASLALTSGGTVTVPAHDQEIADPT